MGCQTTVGKQTVAENSERANTVAAAVGPRDAAGRRCSLTRPMPLFRRTPKPPPPRLEFTVGLRDNRVAVGAAQPGVAQLDELRDYVGSVTGHAAPTPEGRDPVAVLNAKMDFAELVNDAAAMLTLAFEELVDRQVVPAAEVPAQPDLPEVPQQSSTYDYIQATHTRAQARMRWLEDTDQVLRRYEVAVLPPLPPDDDPTLRAPQRR
jgi:hypothetical protein